MSIPRFSSLLLLLGLTTAAFGQTGTPALHTVQPASGSPRDSNTATTPGKSRKAEKLVTAPRLKYHVRTLPNGLVFCSIENHRSPTVAIQVWYRVGGKNDPENRSGFAHLFEHLMFKSTRNMKSEMMDRLTEDVGGSNNASTAEDTTIYHEVVPSNYLETLLWAEADRMSNLVIDESNFLSERAVVEEEYRQSVLAPPYGRLDQYVHAHSFTVHPYQRGVIGNIANLDAATLDDVRRFHTQFYRPDNAILIVSGDLDPAKCDAWVDRYFGRITRPAEPLPKIAVKEPPRTGEKRFEETGPNVPLPAVVINYLVPPASDPDAAALRVTGVILSGGRSARLYQSLVYGRHVATQASASTDLRTEAGLFEFRTIAARGKTPAEVEKATLDEIARLQWEPVSEVELMKARNQVVATALRSRETVQGQASAIGDALRTYGDPERVNTEIARLQAVTTADIRRVVQKYFTPKNRLVVHYASGPAEQGGVSHAPTVATTPPTPFLPTETPPLPAAPRRGTPVKTVEKTLPNGLRIVVASRPGTGLVTVDAQIKAGASDDPSQAAGLANFTAALLMRGTQSRSAAQIAAEAEALGGSVHSSAGWDNSTVGLSVLAARLSEAMPLYADLLRHPAFAADEQARLQSETLDGLAVSLRAPGTLARYAAGRLVFGDTRYGHQPGGTPESLQAIRPEDVARFYQEAYVPKRTVLVFAGDITPAAAFALAERHFGDWTGGMERPAAETKSAPVASGRRVVVVDKPDAGQAAVLLVRTGIPRADPDFVVERVANSVLGDGFSARINQEIRVKRGLSYGAGSTVDEWRDTGLFWASAQTRNDAVPEVASLLEAELTRMAKEPVTEAELVPRKAALAGNYSRRLDNSNNLTSAVDALVAYDQPLDSLNTYPIRAQAVTPAQIQAFAAQHLDVAQASLVIVGDGRKFLEALRKQYPQVEVISIADLDLNRADLHRR